MLSFFEISFYFAYFFLAGSSALTAFEVFSYFPKQYEALKYILISLKDYNAAKHYHINLFKSN